MGFQKLWQPHGIAPNIELFLSEKKSILCSEIGKENFPCYCLILLFFHPRQTPYASFLTTKAESLKFPESPVIRSQAPNP